MKLPELLSRLKSVKKTGENRWVACCPAHEDKTPSLAISANHRTVMLHCFSGCDVESILTSIDMTFDDLYPEHHEHIKPGRIPVSDAMRCIAFESLVVSASAGTARQRSLTDDEVARLIKASGRIQAAMEMSGV